jgi:hypothetical protein
MSTYLSKGVELANPGLGTVLLPGGFENEFPEVSAVLKGSFNQETRFWIIPPASITLFVEGARLKFVCNPRGHGQVCFGTIADASSGLQGLEKALAEGNCEWKPRSGQKNR